MQRSYVRYAYTQATLEGRVTAIKNFYASLVEDSKRAVAIVSRRAVSAAISHVISTGVGLQEANRTIAELVLNGTIEGEKHALMEGSTVKDWVNKIEALALIENFDANISISEVTVVPEDSFSIKVEFKLYAILRDKNFNIMLNKSQQVYTYVDITSFEDPLYPLYTYGRAVNIFAKSPHWLNYSSEDLTNLLDDLNKSYYHPSRYGASFLDRLEGKCLVQNKYNIGKDIGLESFVDKQKLLTLGIPVYPERSSIDYMYFCNVSVPAYQISGMPSSFRLDNQTGALDMTHLQIYNVSSRVVQ
jgi:hypothetical protein